MRRLSLPALLLSYTVALVVWVGVALACMVVGTSEVGWPSGFLFDYRLERVLLASLIGAALGCSGVAYQAVLRNPLAEPYLLGTSSGAMLATYLWASTSLALPAWAEAAGQQGFAFAGAMAAVGIVLLVAGASRRGDSVTFILVGVIVNVLCGSVLLLLMTLLPPPPGTGGALTFLVGGVQTTLSAEQIWLGRIVIFAGFAWLVASAGKLHSAVLSDAEAASMGLHVARLRWTTLLVASLITAAAVSVSGPIGFVGLLAPHAARMIVGPDVRRVLPLATAFGAGLLVIADSATRLLGHASALDTVLPVGVITGLLGGPVLLLLLLRRSR